MYSMYIAVHYQRHHNIFESQILDYKGDVCKREKLGIAGKLVTTIGIIYCYFKKTHTQKNPSIVCLIVKMVEKSCKFSYKACSHINHTLLYAAKKTYCSRHCFYFIS